ncbi:dynamin family protein [Clostridiaceae bacterium NSJ-31]|uniref:Dynamin family protein n=3 Tax=Ligaoa zhengdingensis TaxID=2763658 RepID=A0A926I4I8_9FIRM|nr:dynamin family protein [Ligaoa zhengdingensis]MBC8546543.1 dynamin family protein [Ligaoa zhengdingensis]
MLNQNEAQNRKLEAFSELLDQVCRGLGPYAQYINLTPLTELREAFDRKTDDFFRSGRKFNLAVIGQVKSGKSSFLNALLFGGRDVLPLDCTPKTMALTRVEYSPQTRMTVEYYAPDDWAALEKLAASALESDRARAARETIRMAYASGVDVARCLAAGEETFRFDSYSGLMERLDDYVGEQGRFTALVKCVTLGLDEPALKGVSVIDTPGLNDPIPSRTERTRAFIETCDAAFFLSRASYFLDQNDIALLTEQLPQKGVRRLALIASQYDSALMDVIADCSNLAEAEHLVKDSLRRRAQSQIEAALPRVAQGETGRLLADVLDSCRHPVFLSVLAHRMAQKAPPEWTEQENRVNRLLCLHGQLSAEELGAIGNFEEIQAIFREWNEQREETLRQKAEEFTAIARCDLTQRLRRLQSSAQKALNYLVEVKKPELIGKMREAVDRSQQASDASQALFHDFLAPLDDRLNRAYKALGKLPSHLPAPVKKSGLELRGRTEGAGSAKAAYPWGGKHSTYELEQIAYDYLDAAETLEAVRLLTEGAIQAHIFVFTPFENTAALQNRLLLFGAHLWEQYGYPPNPDRLQSIVRQAAALIAVPRPEYDYSVQAAAFEQQFPGQVRNEQRQAELEQAASRLLVELSEDAAVQLQKNGELFVHNVQRAQGRLISLLLENTNEERSELMRDIAHLEKVIGLYREFLDTLNRYLTK